MEHPAGDARRVLVNLVLRDAAGGSGSGPNCGRRAARPKGRRELSPALQEVDDLAEFRWALAQLPARQRAVLVLRYWADLPVAEVADLLSCSERNGHQHRIPGGRPPRRDPLARRAASHPNPPLRDHGGTPLMLTEELERACAARSPGQPPISPTQEAARQRLLQHHYRLRHGHWRLAAGITAATAVASVVLGIGLTGVLNSAPPRGTGTIQTTAFTLIEHANGTATLTINPDVLLEPNTLQSDLQQDGIPAMVTTGSFCSSHPGPTGFRQVVTGQRSSPGTP